MRVWTRVDKSRKSRERRDCSMSSLSQNIILFFGMFLAGKCTYIPTTNNATKSKLFHQKSNVFQKIQILTNFLKISQKKYLKK